MKHPPLRMNVDVLFDVRDVVFLFLIQRGDKQPLLRTHGVTSDMTQGTVCVHRESCRRHYQWMEKGHAMPTLDGRMAGDEVSFAELLLFPRQQHGKLVFVLCLGRHNRV